MFTALADLPTPHPTGHLNSSNRSSPSCPRHLSTLIFGVGVLLPFSTQAGEADVIDATIQCGAQTCTVSATVRHDDTGWEHYANHWRLRLDDGRELARRVLHHPHENEQPFTRSLSVERLPQDLEAVVVEAHDSVHGYGGATFLLPLPR